MKLVRCEWAPSLVVEWLCGELEERGIPGPTYAHTLLSLLHHHYCPHPAPATPISATAYSGNATGRYHHPLSRRHLDDFDLRDLDLDDLLGHTTHPDADLPDLSSFTPQQRGGSRRARKRHKVRQKQRILTSEQLQKVAALQCLMSASDERYDLESLVEELCSRLKTAAENEHLNATNSTPACGNKDKCVTLNAVSQDSCNDTDDYASSSTPEEQAEKYYAAFPPLSRSCKENCVREKPWKSGDTLCSCVWEGKKSSFAAHSEAIQTSTIKMPRTHRKKCREKEKKEVEAKLDGIAIHEGSRRHHVSFTGHTAAKHKEAQLNESYDTDSASEPERNVDRWRKKFMGPLLDEDIGEGYIGDTSSRESSEDRDKGDQDIEKPRDDKSDKSSGPLSVVKGKMSQEEWECMGDLLLGASDNEGDSLHGGGGSRLFERGSTSGGTSGSSSDVETQEAESVRQLERKISDSVAQVWGQAGESLSHGQGEHVWDPPPVQEMALYTTIWGFNLPEPQDTQDCISLEHSHCSEIIQEPFTPINDDWHQSHSWHAVNPLSEEDPLLCSISGQSPLSNYKENSSKEASTLLHLHNSLEKSIWSDCNANNISGSEGTVLVCMDDQINNTLEPFGEKEAKCHTTEELENKLCESLMQLGLENIWENTLGLEGVFAELRVSNDNLECVSENNSCEEVVHDSQTDSEHEKMMALVEDVCKSYESQEEAAPDSSVIKQMPSGPSGPQADLRHTESSGFSMVIPRSKSVEPNSSLDQVSDNLLMGLGNKTVCHSRGFENTETLPPTQEEENLLTSPRTHFRPIRQDSVGSTADDHYEDGTMFIVNSERPELPFQRTSSGALFLESDLLEGSPKKYMVYKEPVPKLVQTEEEPEVVAHESFQAIALVPKFKVVNNEKFCQTEEENMPSRKRSFCINVEKMVPCEKVCLADHFTCKEDEQEPDVFEFQHQDFPDSNNLASIWKSGPQSSEAGYARNIWQIELEQDRENAWPQLNDIEGGGMTGNAWLEREGEGATGWSSEGHFEPPPESNINQKSEAVVIPTSLASLWHHSNSPTSPTIPSSMTSLQALWTGCTSRVNEDSESDTSRANMYIITNPTTYIPGKFHDSCQMSALTEVGPWKHIIDVEKCVNKKKDQIWLENCLLSNKQKLNTEDHQKRSGTVGAHTDAPGACTELRLEVDQEADELLGAVHAQTASSENLHPSSQPVVADDPSPQPLHERLKKCSSGNPVSKTANSSNPLCKTKTFPQEDTEREDLDDLAPGWEFNDGFEWGPQAVGTHEVEDCLDGVGDDEDGEGGEVLIYETDGTTYTIPVEYLDDSLYDQIFGTSDSATHRLGGSLPDLPLGEPTVIRFSNELEDEWKRSGIPYKVQLPRKPRPGRWLPPSRRPCTFFMEGSCRRSDCKFSHDLASITCRFWEEGSCLKGITCPFLHGYPLRRRRNKSEGAAHSEGEKPNHHRSSFEIDSEMDFPTLGSSCDSKMGSVDERNYVTSNIGNSGSHQAVARKKKRKFITITKNVLGEAKNAETDKTIRRIARRERWRRHTEITAATTDLHTATSTSNEPPPTQLNLRKSKRHRATASGHDDVTKENSVKNIPLVDMV
ncbi:uncharacterized protein LOC121857730 isoform X2 [Homarus americanus]|uniref:uncharacterized protein LOC121857730 isoform X2 n=2 Tax=Homarus americanus TaxID=6706 RepID=UPI001C48871A|nr:uncharacterized protein LOC121857730 isoform X2 [Homarus americanus]